MMLTRMISPPLGTNVCPWLADGQDYRTDDQKGTITRIPAGKIPDGATVLVTYVPLPVTRSSLEGHPKDYLGVTKNVPSTAALTTTGPGQGACTTKAVSVSSQVSETMRQAGRTYKRVVSRSDAPKGSAAPKCSNRSGRDQPPYDPV